MPDELLNFARKWIADRTVPARCIHCEQIQPFTMCTADTRCPKNNYDGHVYQFTITSDPDAHAKELAAFFEAAKEEGFAADNARGGYCIAD
jgi:hypothetical protein